MKMTTLQSTSTQSMGLEWINEYTEWIKGILASLNSLLQNLAKAPAAVKNLALVAVFLLVVEGAQYSATGSYTYHQMSQGPVYGPPLKPAFIAQPYYSFHKVGASFGAGFPLWRLSELSRSQIEGMIIQGAPRNLRKGLRKYLQLGFHFAQEYQVDPFWVLSIMWVESHYNSQVKSPVNAYGLMQLMPQTSHWLNQLLDRTMSPSLAYELRKDPVHNVQLGTFYLQRLLKKFNGNYVHATVAYNMGPGDTKRRLRWGLPVGTKNLYLNKVRRAYRHLTRGVNKHFRSIAPTYTNTYVYPLRYDPLAQGNAFHMGSVLVTLSN